MLLTRYLRLGLDQVNIELALFVYQDHLHPLQHQMNELFFLLPHQMGLYISHNSYLVPHLWFIEFYSFLIILRFCNLDQREIIDTFSIPKLSLQSVDNPEYIIMMIHAIVRVWDSIMRVSSR